MSFFQLTSRFFWVLLLAFCLFNYLAARRWVGTTGSVSPANLKAAYRHLAWLALISSLPWFVMGWAEIVGGIPNMFYFLRPQDRNPYVIGWIALVLLLSILYAGWVLLAGGARKVKELQLMSIFGMRSNPAPSENTIKIIAALMPLIILVSLYVATVQNVSAPP